MLGMAAWLGAALSVGVIRAMRGRTDEVTTQKIMLEIITRIEIPASFFIPLTGILMMVDQTHWLTVGWIHIKIFIGLLAIGFSHVSRVKLVKIIDNRSAGLQAFSWMRTWMVTALVLVLSIVGYN